MAAYHRLRGPTVGGDSAVPRVDTDWQTPPRVFAAGLTHNLGVLNRGGSEYHPPHAAIEPRGGGLQIPNATAKLHRDRDGREDIFSRHPR